MAASGGPPADSQAVSGPATHTYEDGDAFGMRLGPPLKGDPRSAPPVPSTPRPGRTTDGAQPVAAATHVYEDGESFGMRLGPALNRDAPAVPSTPRPGRPTGGAQQVPGGPNPLSNPQDVINQLRPNPMYNSNQAPQAPGSAKESSTICGRLRRRLSRRPLLYTVMSLSLTFVTTVSLAIVVPVLLTHFNRQPGIHGSPATTIAGPKTTDSGAWQSSAVLMGTDKVTSADVIKVIPVHGRGPSLAPLQPATATAGPKATDSGAWKCSAARMGTGKVTSADVIKVSPVHGRGPSPGITAEMEAAGPAPINLPGSTGTGETSDQASRPRIITFGDEPGAGKLRSARGVAVSPDNKIWVADRSTPRLKVYSMEGVYLHQFPQAAPGLGYSSKTPSDVSIDKDGHLWVLMIGYPASPDSVVQVTRDGDLKANFDLPGSVPRGGVRGMAVGLCNNHVYVTWSDGHSRGGVQAFTPDGKLLWNTGPRMMKPIYVAVDGKENIFVSDIDTSFIYMYDETGRYVMKFGGPGLSGGRLNRPEGICVDSSGHIMVVDSFNKRVVMYTGRGGYVRHIALRAEYPKGVAVGPGGQLVVAHSYTITVFPRY
uniref:SMP-30/Gluconolactonase/LRE-like region domain-containing protein n=1 Tax=Branchiostoma floridae TaxID=7739 RepID=C3ZAU2_BRAFL|eukprot:XP_002593968.1 hypothetical protein BRAFLDRAFT_68595 [Branchiostoma floridae]